MDLIVNLDDASSDSESSADEQQAQHQQRLTKAKQRAVKKQQRKTQKKQQKQKKKDEAKQAASAAASAAAAAAAAAAEEEEEEEEAADGGDTKGKVKKSYKQQQRKQKQKKQAVTKTKASAKVRQGDNAGGSDAESESDSDGADGAAAFSMATDFEFEDSNAAENSGGAITSGNWDFLTETDGAKGKSSANPHRSARTGNLDAKIEAMRARILAKGEVELSDDDELSDSEMIEHAQTPADAAAGGGGVDGGKKQQQQSSVADELFTQRAEIQDYFGDRNTLDVSRQRMAASFVELKLSRPLQRGVQALRYERPTPIQATVIPLALEGRDVCASAQTGSGKTAAFLLPTLERLLFRGKGPAVTRVAIITPTRELATQIHSMLTALAQFTDVRGALVVGGLSLQIQAAELRGAPDVVVCTPGRMIDHLRNSMGVHFDGVEILILDEADRLLGMGFTEEVHELVNYCPRQKGSRQTMLFSATMTAGVEELIKLSLHRPIRVAVNTVGTVADHLVQEFVRIRPKFEANREAVVLALCKRSLGPLVEYAKQRGQGGIIVFCNRKRQAHRLMLLFGLFGLRAAELHGNLTQRQRAEAITRFKSGDVNYLVATDLAARGLDVEGVLAVVNMDMPKDHRTYIHRVGRTARAGRSGRSITLVGEKGRSVLRAIMKSHEEANKKTAAAAAGGGAGAGAGAGADDAAAAAAALAKSSVMKSRQVSNEVVTRWQERIEAVEADLSTIMKDESLEKRLQQVEMEARRATNLMVHAEEIQSRPKRTWFQSAAAKQRSAEEGHQGKAGRGLGDAAGGDGDGGGGGLSAKPLKAERPRGKTKLKSKKRRGGDDGDGDGSGDDTPRRAYRAGGAAGKRQVKGAAAAAGARKGGKAAGGLQKKARWESGRNGKVGKDKRANNPVNY